MTKKQRIDLLLVEKGLSSSRNEAQKLIMAGLVYHQTQRIDKASEVYLLDAEISIKQKEHQYVGRGGLKLLKALQYFDIKPKNFICLDIGASTGGFTDCLLQHQAKKVYALDVGYNQLDWKLRNHPQVVVLEKTNFRHFDVNLIEDKIDLVCVDVSFISLDKILPNIKNLFVLEKNQDSPKYLIALIKPQFEVGAQFIGKKGVVKDEIKKQEAIIRIKTLALELGFEMKEIIPSPIQGREGNEEFLMVGKFSY